jgi:cytochrome c oxidase subunit 3
LPCHRTDTEAAPPECRQCKAGWHGIVADWSSDQRAFKNVSWGKAMMWIFLLSDTFIFGCFLMSYMTARMSTTVPWPNPSEVFALRSPAPPPADPDRDHDLRPDQQQRHDGDGGQFRLPPRPPQDGNPDAGDRAARRGLRRHAGLRMDQADLTKGVRPWGNPWGAEQFGSSFFMITGFHGTHVTIGVIFLIIVARKVWRGDFDTGGAASSRAGRATTKSSRSWALLALRRSRLGLHLRVLLSLVREAAMSQPTSHVEIRPATEGHPQGQHHPIRLYLVVWVWLFILSTCSYLVDYFQLAGLSALVAHPDLHGAEGRPDRRRLHAHGLGAIGLHLCDPAAADCCCWSSSGS